MTGKELLYVEDALGHAKFMMTQASEAAGKLSDVQLKQQAQQMVNDQQQLFTKFMQLV